MATAGTGGQPGFASDEGHDRPGLAQWDLRPAPTRLVEVVDRLVEGDTVVMLFPTERGTLQMGPQ